jgi:SET domain
MVVPPPAAQSCPHGTQERVAVALSTMPAAGNGLYGIRLLPNNPQLFYQKGQFICSYATQKHQITSNAAKASSSRYMWSTNLSTKHNSKALYFDAAAAPHYVKYLNDLWNLYANNCELRWNPATGRVEVFALRDILLNEELGLNYGAPSWYHEHNGLTSRERAIQVQTHYGRTTLP